MAQSRIISLEKIPVWIQAIFAREYSVNSNKELENKINEWLVDTGNYKSFDQFFKALVKRTKPGDYPEGKVHSIRNFSEGDYRNCNALATISAIKGALHFGKPFKVVIDYQGGLSPETGQAKEFRSHVSLTDGNNNYGGRKKEFDKTEVKPEKILALLYMLGDAYMYWQAGKRNKSRAIASEIEKQMKEEGIKSSYIKRRLKETNSNF